jgi:hypothetical protein
MQLHARKKRDFLDKEPSIAPHGTKEAAAQPSREEAYREVLNIRLNALLYNTIQNMVTASHTAQDFTYASPADFIRAALLAYRDGQSLTELEGKGEKITTTIRVDRATKEFYASLPDRLRSKLLERAIRTFLKQRG